ncbi:MFS transporter [Candidatus Amarobacter glycogenicus]|uniref:MFS transporter n=1 Tax=Candidatus Amarobacter glycogenicus TaxID=3140699 RepID=UPI003134A295|nr:MFS transporter [Dehalococcoidia bacterium]
MENGAVGGWRMRVPALQNRDFRILWAGMFFSSATMMFQFYAQGWFILSLTDSASLLGLVGVARGLGMLTFSLFGGALADRMDRRTLLMTTQGGALAVYALLTVLVALDAINLWAAFALIFVSASIESMDGPTRQALLPDLVPREHLPNAIALFTAATISSYAFLPPMAGIAIETIGVAGAFGVSLIGHVVVIGALLLMRSRPSVPRPRDNIAVAVGRGIAYASGRPRVRWIIVLSLLTGTLGFPIISTLAPFWMTTVLGLGAVGWTFMGWAWGLGAVGATVYLSTRGHSRGLGWTVVLSAAAFGLSLVLFGMTRSVPIAAVFWCLNGACFTTNMISSASLLQMIVESAYVGRVMSLRMVSSAFNQLAAWPLGAVADGFGVERMVRGVAATLTVLVLAAPALSRTARSLDADVGKDPDAADA